jgi:hypothetical protein
VNHFEKVLVTESGWRHRDVQLPSRDNAGATISSTDTAQNLVAAFYGGAGWDQYMSSIWMPWMWDSDVQGVVLFALGGAPHKWGHTNYVDLSDQGQILRLKPGFAELVRP